MRQRIQAYPLRKTTLDSLVSLGLLVDDRETLVELAPVQFERGKAKATTITLEDI